MTVYDFLKYAVCYKISGWACDDGQEHEGVSAVFRYAFQAEEFIEKCIPQENRDRFYVKRLD